MIRNALAALGLLVAGAGAAGAAAPVCAPDQAVVAAPDGRVIARFTVEIADTEAEREQGLMDRRQMARSSGMLFIYPQAREVAFWMHDTLIPLDMIFFDAQGRVISVHANARPLDETAIPSGGAAQFVLEINGGLAHRLGIVAGDLLAHPAIARDTAALPCATR